MRKMLSVLYFSPSEFFLAPRSELTRTVNEVFTLYYVKRRVAYSRSRLLVNFATYPFILSGIIEKPGGWRPE